MSSSPYLLPFEILSCDGGCDGPEFEIQNALQRGEDTYCSTKDKNINILLKYTGDSETCTITNYVVCGPPVDYTAPVKTGLVFFSESEIDVAATSVYDGFTIDAFKALDKTEGVVPCAFFDTQNGHYFAWSDVVKPAAQNVGYVLFKIIDAFAQTNVDLNFLGLIGFDGNVECEDCFPTICEELDLVPPPPAKFQMLDDENADSLGAAMTSIFFYDDDHKELGAVIKEVLGDKASSDNWGIIYWADESNDMYYPIREYFGVHDPVDVLFFGKDNKQYLWSRNTEDFSGVSVVDFYEKAVDHELPLFFKSAPIPEVATIDGLTTIVGDSFDDYTTNVQHARIVYIFNPFISELERFTVEYTALAKALEGKEDLDVCILDAEVNDFNTTMVPSVPTLLLLQPDSEPKRFKSDEFTLEDLLDFIDTATTLDRDSILESLPELIEDLDRKTLKNVIRIEEEDEFHEIIKSENLTVVDWSAVWCAPCHQIAPVFADLSERYTDVNFLKIDIDEFEELSEMYRISAFPTFTFIKKRRILTVIEGADEEGLVSTLETLSK